MVYKLAIDMTKGYDTLLAIKFALSQWFMKLIYNDLMHIGNCIFDYWFATHDGEKLLMTFGGALSIRFRLT